MMKIRLYAQFYFLSALSIFFCLLSLPSFGRPVAHKSPDELFQIADTVINGEVLSVQITSESSSLTLGSNQPLPTRVVIAKIQPLASFKNATESEITLRFPVLDPDKVTHVMNGPDLPYLQVGGRYHFYLKQIGPAAYVTALEGDFDSGAAVHAFILGEEAQNPPLFKQEAEQLAVDFFRQHRELPPNPQLSFSFNRNRWTVQISTEGGLYYPAFTYDARIGINAERQISPDSFVGREIPRKGEWFDQSCLHTKVRLTVAGYFTEKGYQPEESRITELVGQIDSLAGPLIMGTFSSKSFDSDAPPKRVSFPRGALRSVQKIF